MMKIMITHIPNTFNFGSAMMAINFIYYLNKESKDNIEFYTDARSKEDLQNLINWTGLKNIKVNSILPDKATFNGESLNLDIDWVNSYCDGIIKYYDYLIVLGGDDLSEYYSKEILINELHKIHRISEEIPVILIGQTIGPFTEWRKEYASEKLRKCRIYTRDLVTYNYLKEELKLNNVIKSADLAFLDLPMQLQYDTDEFLKNYNLNKEQYITVVPSGLVSLYSYDYDNYIENWEKIIEYLIKSYNKKVILLPHVIRPKEVDDRLIIEELIKKNEHKYKKRVIYIKDKLTSLKGRILLGNGKFTITGRMHAAVSTFQMFKPAISLSYSIKYDGVIGKGLDCKELIVECGDNDKWFNKDVAKEVIEKIDYVERNYEDLNKKVKVNTVKCKNEAMSTIKDVCARIRGEVL